MNLRYVVNGLGIFIDPEVEKKAKRFVHRAFKRQLEGLESQDEHPQLRQELHVHHYDSLNLEGLTNGRVFPANSVYDLDSEIFAETHLQVAFKIETNKMHVWVNAYTAIPPPFLFHFLFLQLGQVFIHSAGLSIDGGGVLFPGFGGVGKTAIITEALKRDSNTLLLGDDLVLGDEKGYLHSYPRPFCIYPYHIPLFEPFMKNENIKIKPLTFPNRVVKKIKTLLDIHDDVAYQYKTISPYKVIGQDRVAQEPIPLKQVYMINRHRGIKKLEVVPVTSTESVADYCVNILAYEWNAYFRIISQLYAHRLEALDGYYSFQRRILTKCLSNATKVMELRIPEHYGVHEVAGEVLEVIYS